jgi:hypothetical protein
MVMSCLDVYQYVVQDNEVTSLDFYNNAVKERRWETNKHLLLYLLASLGKWSPDTLVSHCSHMSSTLTSMTSTKCQAYENCVSK